MSRVALIGKNSVGFIEGLNGEAMYVKRKNVY